MDGRMAISPMMDAWQFFMTAQIGWEQFRYFFFLYFWVGTVEKNTLYQQTLPCNIFNIWTYHKIWMERPMESCTFWSTVTDRMIIFFAFSLSMLFSPRGSIWAARWPLTWQRIPRYCFWSLMIDVHLIGPDGPLNSKMCINDLGTGCSAPHARQGSTQGGQSNLVGVCCVAQGGRCLVRSSPRDTKKLRPGF